MRERPKILTKKDLNDFNEMKSSYRYRAEYRWIDPLGGINDSYCITVLGYGDDWDELIKSAESVGYVYCDTIEY